MFTSLRHIATSCWLGLAERRTLAAQLISAQWLATLKDAQSAVEFLVGAVRMLTGQHHLVGKLDR